MPIKAAGTPTCVRFNAAELDLIADLRDGSATVSEVLRKALRAFHATTRPQGA